MQLKQLKLRNFGLYRGEQIFDLQARPDNGRQRPIVLIGGHNGAGKTTILEAVRLCLYGRVALGPRIADSEYQVYLRERIHKGREASIPITYASVALEFDFSHSGKRTTYLVQRAWEARGATGVTEYLRVLSDGTELADIESQFWPEFVRSLIPPGISQLFFFDGEKIKRLAEEDSEAETLSESIKALLGLDLVERLQADLDLYGAKFLKKTATDSVAARLEEIESDERQLMRELEQIQAEEGVARRTLDDLLARIGGAEEQLAQRGEGLSAMRGELRELKAQLTARQEHIEKEVRELCETALPFTLCPTLAKQLVEQLRSETERDRWEKSRVEIKNALAKMRSRLTQASSAKRMRLSEFSRAALRDELSVIARELLEAPAPLANLTRIHDVSDKDRTFVEQTLGLGLARAAVRAKELAKELNIVTGDLRQTQERLNRAPDSDEMAPMVKELSGLQEQHATTSLQLKLKEEKRRQLEGSLAGLARERERIMKGREEAQKIASRLSLALSARHALDEYLIQLTTAKAEQLARAALSCFSALSRKSDLVHRLEIDPKTFVVTLYDDLGQVIPKSSLSAGEKQIYAIALLWALARVSGRSLPMIIDTPLGRLDSVHRQHLVERYFPVASHQVIILSTDTEVDQRYFEQLGRHTSHAIRLVNDAGCTQTAPGYFWGESANAGAAA